MKLIYDQAAHRLLRDHKFIKQWRTLHDNCHYATAFQEPEFVCAWYDAYQNQWQPVILYRENSQDEFVGLLLLAYNSANKTIAHAGGEQAEYQSWLALPDEGVSFLSTALDELAKQFDFATLRFRYLPVIAPLVDTLERLPGKHRVSVRKRQRPLMTLNAVEVKASFAKKSNKSRFNRLKKLGTVEFHRLSDNTELDKVFDELIAFYDLRQGGVNHSKPFQEDINKRKFHAELFATASSKIYVTVTYLNDRPIAGFWGLVSKNCVHNGMIMHSPFLAEHSLGKLHLMQLSELLLKENIDILDLTPGSDPWKERFANAHDEVAEAIIYRSSLSKIKGELIYSLLNWLRQKANRAGVTTAKLKTILKMVREVRPSMLVQWIRSNMEIRIYQIDRFLSDRFQRDERICCNSLSDLLLYAGHSESSFLSVALAQLEAGEKVYTMNIDHRLAYCCWMKTNHADQQPIVLPPNSITIHDLYIHDDFEQSGLYKKSIEHLLSEAFSDEKVQQAFVFVPAENKQYCTCVEELGLSFKSSFTLANRFGNEKILNQ